MKNIFSALGALCLVLMMEGTSAQTPPLAGSVIIKGKIEGMTSGTVSVTAEVFGEKKSFDAPVVQGKFEVKINQPSPSLYSLIVKGEPDSRLVFFADNGIIQVDAIKGAIPKGKISGSLSNKELSQYNTIITSFEQKLANIQQVYTELGQAGKLLPKQDSLEKTFNVTMGEKDLAIQTWVLQHKGSYVSPLVIALNYLDDGDAGKIRLLYDGLTPEVKLSYFAKYVEGALSRLEGLNIGKTAPLFAQTDAAGKPISLESFKGKYVLIDFWASWCGPCRQENPNLVRTYQKFKNRNLEILGVSLDNSKDKWLQAIQEDQLSWKHVSDLKGWRNDVAVQYGVQSIPANFLVDKEGKIIAKGLRGPALEQALEQLLK